MLLFGAYQKQSLKLDVPVGMTVKKLKDVIQDKLGISVDVYRQEKKVLVLSYGGAELGDTWVFSDLGILPGTTIKIQLKENITPVLHIRCSHNHEIISLLDDMKVTSMRLEQLRSMVSMKTGLPVGIFRLTTSDGREMYDSHSLDDYGVEVGDTVLLETWDGWAEFLNLAIMGFTPQVIAQVNGVEVIARFQMKVALFIASHFGHVDLARGMLKQGVRADEPTGYHPSRMWCKDTGHVDSQKCPVHEATLCGQIGVLRLFINHDITCIKAKDGLGLEPLNIALRGKVKNCATFLLSKQWTKIHIKKNFALHIATYTRLRKWCDRAKEQVLIKYGYTKSSMKRRNFNGGALVSHGVVLDGYSKSPMTGKSNTELMKEERDTRKKEGREQRFSVPVAGLVGSMEDPEHYFKTMTAIQTEQLRHRLPRYPLRWQKSYISSRMSGGEANYAKTSFKGKTQIDGSRSGSLKLRTLSLGTEESSVSSDRPYTHRTNFKGLTNAKIPSRLFPIVNKSTADRGQLQQAHTSPSESSLYPIPFAGHIQRTNKNTAVISHRSVQNLRNQLAISETSTSSNTDDIFLEDNKVGIIKKKKRRLSVDTFLPSNFNGSKNSIPLPAISHEQGRRPFFYHNGLREDELVDSVLGLITKYKGDSSRNRAIQSLSLANSFSEIPWLARVRVALNLTRNSLKRSAKRFRESQQSVASN